MPVFTVFHDSFADLVPDVNDRLPLNTRTFITNLFPVIVLYYIAAVLAILPGTLPLRLALLPVTLWLAFRAATSIDVVGSDPGYGHLGYSLGLGMIIISMRVVEWTLIRKPLRRLPINEVSLSKHNGHANGSPNTHPNGHAKSSGKSSSLAESGSPTLPEALWDACDLLINARGCGWNWAQEFPPETRPTSSTAAFLAFTLLSALKHFLISDVAINTVRSFSPSTLASPTGGTIYDPSLPSVHRYARSTLITLFSGITINSSIQMSYDVSTIIGILVFRQRPVQWPPMFDSPWLSTSLAMLWSKRWHQNLRSIFIAIGARPLSFFIGRVGGVIGAFFWSAVLHDWALWSTGRGTEFWSVGGFFLMMGVGCIAEALFMKWTGRKVGGWAGWLWTVGWVVGWGNILVDAHARRGFIGSKFVPEGYMPSQIVLSLMSQSFA